jgi:hypothetical protein
LFSRISFARASRAVWEWLGASCAVLYNNAELDFLPTVEINLTPALLIG